MKQNVSKEKVMARQAGFTHTLFPRWKRGQGRQTIGDGVLLRHGDLECHGVPFGGEAVGFFQTPLLSYLPNAASGHGQDLTLLGYFPNKCAEGQKERELQGGMVLMFS